MRARGCFAALPEGLAGVIGCFAAPHLRVAAPGVACGPTMRIGRVTLLALSIAGCGDNLEPTAAPDAAAPDAAKPAGTAIPLTTPDGTFYTAQVTIGAQMFALDVDTGSTTIGVAGASCAGCTTAGVSPLYMPGTGAMDSMRTAKTQYGDGSGWSGEIFTDMVALGSVMPEVGVGFVNITTESGFFDGNMNLYQGIFGLGPSLLLEPGTTSYLDAIKAKGVSNAMAFELCDDRGTMWLGGFDPAAAAGPAVYTPIVGGRGFWGVHVNDIALDGESLGVDVQSAGAPIVDTGTTLWYMPSTVVAAIVDRINASPGREALFGTAMLSGGTTSGTGMGSGSGSGDGSGSGSGSGSGGGGPRHRCLIAAGVTADQVDAMLPAFSMSLPDGQGGTVTISAPATRSYLEDLGSGRFCLNVANGTNLGVSILGDRFLRSFVTTIDIPNNRIGFAPDKGCSTAARSSIVREPSEEHGHPPHAS